MWSILLRKVFHVMHIFSSQNLFQIKTKTAQLREINVLNWKNISFKPSNAKIYYKMYLKGQENRFQISNEGNKYKYIKIYING